MTPASEDLTRRDIDVRDRRHGFSKIGYHYVVRRDGTVEEGRPIETASMHDETSIAKESVSVCLIGGMGAKGEPQNNFTREQLDALGKLQFGLSVRYVTPALSAWR